MKLVFIPGIYAKSKYYNGLLDILRKKYDVETIDLDYKKFKSIKSITDKIPKGNITLMAHSAGAIPAIIYASKNKVKELILISPAGLPAYKNRYKLYWRLFWKSMKLLILHPSLFPKTIGALHLFLIQNKQFKKTVKKVIHTDYSTKLKKIKSKTTIIWATGDEIFDRNYIHNYKSKIKNSKLKIVKGSHDWPIINPRVYE